MWWFEPHNGPRILAEALQLPKVTLTELKGRDCKTLCDRFTCTQPLHDLDAIPPQKQHPVAIRVCENNTDCRLKNKRPTPGRIIRKDSYTSKVDRRFDRSSSKYESCFADSCHVGICTYRPNMEEEDGRGYKERWTFEKKEESLKDAAAMLKKVVHDAESKSALELMREFLEAEENNDSTFKKKAATLQEAAADMEEKVNEVEEDAALGLLEEELKDLEEELEEL
ncbi:hypothetical protein Bbelb_305770 [Branchiostoma belcheri]|nr:hypothetical protein Bbelb_305770 [Branchiostoma belcheri]